MMMTDTQPTPIHWPQTHRPEATPLYVRNELAAEVSIETAWAWLIRASRWSEWYANCRNLVFENEEEGPDLALGTRFRWTTFGVRIPTVVEEFEAPYRLAWRGRTPGTVAYHAWYLEPRASGGCWILTEETQRGIVPGLGRWLLKPQMSKWHQRWLEGLAAQAATGKP